MTLHGSRQRFRPFICYDFVYSASGFFFFFLDIPLLFHVPNKLLHASLFYAIVITLIFPSVRGNPHCDTIVCYISRVLSNTEVSYSLLQGYKVKKENTAVAMRRRSKRPGSTPTGRPGLSADRLR